MKSLFAVSIFILLFCGGTFAQTNETVPCPTISIESPGGIAMPGETVTFTAEVSKEVEKLNLKYVWTVVGGEIIKGQETPKIEVKTPEISYDLTATVKVLNLPKNCLKDSDSMKTFATVCVGLLLIDEFSISSNQIDKAKFNNLAKESQNDPYSQVYIIEKFEKNTSLKTIELKNQKIIDYLMTKGIERNRIDLLNAFGNENLTQLILVPAGASPPVCDECVTVQPK